MSKNSNTRPQDPAHKSGINWDAVKMNVITALVFGIAGLIGGYFIAINIHGTARAAVIEDLKITSKTAEQQ